MSRTLYLKFKTFDLADVEAMKDDIRCVISPHAFWEYLRSTDFDDIETEYSFVHTIELLNEIRGEYFEANFENLTPYELASKRMKTIAQKWGLFYVED